MNDLGINIFVEEPQHISLPILFVHLRQARRVIIITDNHSDRDTILGKVRLLNPEANTLFFATLEEAKPVVKDADNVTVILCDYLFPSQPGSFEKAEPNARFIYNIVRNTKARFVVFADKFDTEDDTKELELFRVRKIDFFEASISTEVQLKAKKIVKERNSCYALLEQYVQKKDGRKLGTVLVRCYNDDPEIREGATEAFAQFFLERGYITPLISLLQKSKKDLHTWNGVWAGVEVVVLDDISGRTNKAQKELSEELAKIFSDKEEVPKNIRSVFRDIFNTLGGIRGTRDGSIDMNRHLPTIKPPAEEKRGFMDRVRDGAKGVVGRVISSTPQRIRNGR
jgi:hypothetical protein